MSNVLQAMLQKKENVGLLGRLYFWHLPVSEEFMVPQSVKPIPDLASIAHLLIIAREIFQYNLEFCFKKHASDLQNQATYGNLK